MRPLLLEFSGLRSYRRQARIDFTDYDLFAVIGDTGAGKSTIIEALSLALYATKTWKGGATTENLIADGENTMTIHLCFTSGNAEWEVTRTRHRNASAPVNKLVCPGTGEMVDGAVAVTSRVTELIGLTHEQFTRAVVMPQGRFDELLQAGTAERNKILRSIFGLGDLEVVRERARDLATEWDTELARHEERRRPLPADPVAAHRQAIEELDKVEKRHGELSDALEEAEKIEVRIGELGSSSDRLTAALSRLPSLASDPLVGLKEIHEIGHALLAERTEHEEERRAADERIADLNSEIEAKLRGFESRDDAVRAVTRLDAAATNVSTALDVTKRLDEEADALASDPAEDASEKTGGLDAAVAEAEATLAERQQAEQELRARTDAAAAAFEQLASARNGFAEASSAVDGMVAELTEAKARVTAATEATNAADLALAAARKTLDDARRSEAAVHAAFGHEPGDPCPVCDRPLPDDFEHPDHSDLAAADKHVSQADKVHREAQQEAAAAESAINVLSHRHADSLTRRETAEAVLSEATGTLTAVGLDPNADPNEARRQLANDLDQAATASRTAQQKLSDTAATRAGEQSRAQAETEARQQALIRIDAQRAEAAATSAKTHATLSELPPAWVADIDSAAASATVVSPVEITGLARAIETMLDDITELATKLANTQAQQTAAAKAADEVSVRATESVTGPAAEILAAVRNRLAITVELAVLLPDETSTGDEREVLANASLPGSAKTTELPGIIEVVEQALAAAEVVRAAGSELDTNLSAQIAEARGSLQAILTEAECVSLAEIRTNAARVQSDLAVAEKLVASAADEMALAERTDEILGVLRPLSANLKVIEHALRDRDGRFIDHLIEKRELELLAEASRRLKLISSGRYGFVPDFGVANIASGEIRPPDALSGGERFQAALALALALVEIASRGGGHLDAVFVDEGFGSLDSAALDAALETLGGVAGGGKMVGLISHLRPVAEYVDTVLHVTKDDTEGSRIRPLDPAAREQLLDDEVRSGLTN